MLQGLLVVVAPTLSILYHESSPPKMNTRRRLSGLAWGGVGRRILQKGDGAFHRHSQHSAVQHRRVFRACRRVEAGPWPAVAK